MYKILGLLEGFIHLGREEIYFYTSKDLIEEYSWMQKC